MLIARKSYLRALEMCDKILSLSPDDVEARVKLGIILAESGRIDESENVFKEALRLKPWSIEALRNLGALYGNSGNFDKAILVWEKILAIDPGNEKAKEAIERARQMKEGTGK